MMGTSSPSAMRSTPFLKRSIWPCRVISPSAKMPTRSPSCRARRAAWKERTMALGLSWSEMGMTPMARKNQCSTGMS